MESTNQRASTESSHGLGKMDDNDSLDASNGSGAGSGSQSVRKNIPLKLKSGGKQRGRSRKTTSSRTKKTTPAKKTVEDEAEDETNLDDLPDELEFSTMKIAAGPGEPLHHNHKLNWDHKVRLLGQKVVDPLIHSCERCGLPILIYGRMIPCKHIFCLDCAKKTENRCPRCKDQVLRIEQSALGTVFVCTFGGGKHSPSGCHRTYLSQRDLQAHIDHRHSSKSSKDKALASASPKVHQASVGGQLVANQTANLVAQHPPVALDGYGAQTASGSLGGSTGVAMSQGGVKDLLYRPPRAEDLPQAAHGVASQNPAPLMQTLQQQPTALPQTHLPPPAHLPPPVSTNLDSYHNMTAPRTNTNLITIQIQDEADYSHGTQPGGSYQPGLYPPPGNPQLRYPHPPPQTSYPSQHPTTTVAVTLPTAFSSPPPAHGNQYPTNVAPPQVGLPQVGLPPQVALPQQVGLPTNRPPLQNMCPPPTMTGPPPPAHSHYQTSQRPAGPYDPQASTWPNQGPPPRGPPPPRPQTGYYQ